MIRVLFLLLRWPEGSLGRGADWEVGCSNFGKISVLEVVLMDLGRYKRYAVFKAGI